MRHLLLVLYLIIFCTLPLSAQEYTEYLSSAKSHLESGNIDKAISCYNVYKSMTGKINDEFEEKLNMEIANNWGDIQKTDDEQYDYVGSGPSQPVTDIDGNVYKTVKLGNQVWMAENLRTTRYADGTPIPLGTTASYDVAYRYYPNNNSANVSTYGYLYNWAAVMNGLLSSCANPSGVQGICPDGWHVPSDAEWTELTNYVKSQSQYVCGSSTSNIAKALASETGWNSSTDNCDVGNNSIANNATGFSARPAGTYSLSGYGFFGNSARFWSATQVNSDSAFNRYLYYGNANVTRYDYYKRYGFSVRCVRN